jgi:hypothetical protein
VRPYVIVSPPFDPVSGGVRVMYGLYGWLLAKGQIVFMNQKLVQGESIGIYPEIEHGNPAGATTVVRYILNRPGVVDGIYSDGTVKPGPKEFGENDLMYYFSRLYGGSDENTMFLPILNLHLWQDQHKKRDKACYFVGKGIKEAGIEAKFIHPIDAVNIERKDALDQQALADFLNECHTMYCYDPNTAMTEIARLCGVRVVYVNPLYTKDEYSKYEPGMNGINWGKDEGIDLNTEHFRAHYQEMVHSFEHRLDRFIRETQNAN